MFIKIILVKNHLNAKKIAMKTSISDRDNSKIIFDNY